MTPEEARIARIAANLALDIWAASEGQMARHERVIETFIRIYHPDRPCHYDIECIETGRCPREIACNN